MSKSKNPGNLPANIEQDLQERATKLAGRIQAPQGKFIKLGKDKTFIMPDGTKSDEPMNVVIVEFTNRNMYYAGKYDPKNVVPPVCFAIGQVINELVPSENSPDKQHSNCAGCPQNQFSKDGGGKPCKNTRYLALMAPTAKGPDDPILVLSVSPTGLKSFDAYVASVSKNFRRPPVGVITEISFDETKDYQTLKFGNPRPNPNVQYHMSRIADAEAILNVEPLFQAKGDAGGKSKGRGRTVR